MWVSGGNEAADQAAKAALASPVSNSLVPAADWLSKPAQYVKDKRKQQWDDIENK